MDPQKLEQQRKQDREAAAKAQTVLQSSAASLSRAKGVVATIESLSKLERQMTN